MLLFLSGVTAGAIAILLVATSRRKVNEQNSILVASELLLSSVKDLETSNRGFALTGEDAYLQRLRSAEALFPRELAALHIDEAKSSSLRG